MARVLVIDDEQPVRDVMVALLAQDGHDAASAPSARAALAYAAGHPVDVVITDMFMPEQDGFDTLAEFRQRFPKTALVAMSGGGRMGQKAVLEIARCLGAATLEKPISLAALHAVLEEVLAPAPAPARERPFLPAELASPADVQAMHARLMATPMLVEMLDALPGLVVLLNRQRQAVFVNRAALRRFGFGSEGEVVGLRPGVLLQCAHAGDNLCGTTEYCRYCGAGRALAASLKGKQSELECRIATIVAGDELDLRVAASPITVGGDELLLLAVTDIADEKRREALEAMFFHDVLNTAGGIQGLSHLIRTADTGEVPAMQSALERLSDALVDEIQMQRGLVLAERGELPLLPAPLDAREVLEAVAARYSGHEVAKGRDIAVEPVEGTIAFSADPTILGRVLGNMVKNALEAVPVGATVRLRATREPSTVRFEVQNAGEMPEAAQKQVFQRSFSTKGAARGLGTYGMRLLTERYLGGHVWFESDAGRGTRFVAEVPATVPAPGSKPGRGAE
ncbi:MAG: response regulator [Gemmatimonadetes bacterium]|nr:response regulator [Gemmatimonadota bacterium]